MTVSFGCTVSVPLRKPAVRLVPSSQAGDASLECDLIAPAHKLHAMSSRKPPIPVAIVMGSQSDWDTMQAARDALAELGVESNCQVVSAHRTPKWMFDFAQSAAETGYQVIIAGAGGAAHLPGMIASLTTLPVLGVPVQSKTLSGMDSLLSIVQMPGGVPVGTLAIGTSGARNAGLLAARILGLADTALSGRLQQQMADQTNSVMENRQL